MRMSNSDRLGHASTPAHPRLRIALVTETYSPEINGVALTLGHIAHGLLRCGNVVQLVRPRQSPSDRAGKKERYEEILVTGMPLPGYPGLRMGWPAHGVLSKHWSQERPDVVHIATEGALGWSALRVARKLKIVVTTDFRTNFHSYSKHYGFGLLTNGIYRYLRWLHNQAACTMVPTEAMRNKLSADGFENLRVVARGVDTQLFNPARRSQDLRRSWGVEASDVVALYVGRLAPEKNLPLVLQAFEAMRGVMPRGKLVLVGDGPARAVLQAKHPQHIFCGMHSGEDLARHYASGDVFLFPSTTETFGNVTLEAMASGLAVVAYDYAAARQHIVHWTNGLLAALGDAGEFISRALEVVKRPQQAAALRLNARASAEKLSWDVIVQAFEMELRRVTDFEGRQHELALVSSGSHS